MNAIETREVLDLLGSFVDKNLVVTEEEGGHTRFRLLETVRQYAGERLLETGESDEWRTKHRDNFLAFAEEAVPQLSGPDQGVWLERFEIEHDNLRSALKWCREQCDGNDLGLRLAGALWRFWWIRGHISEGRDWLTGLLAVEPGGQSGSVRALALNGAGSLASQQGDYTAALELLAEGLAIRRELGDRLGVAVSLNSLGNVAKAQGDHLNARAVFEESLAIFRELDDRYGVAVALGNLGIMATEQVDYPTAWTMHQESLAIMREAGNRLGIAMALCNLGFVALHRGEYSMSEALQSESLTIARDLGDRRTIANALQGLGAVAGELDDRIAGQQLLKESVKIWQELGDPRGIAGSLEQLAPLAHPPRAAQIWGASERLRKEIGSPLMPCEISKYDRRVSSARADMGDDAAFYQAWQEGRLMTTEQAVEFALEANEA